MSRIIPIYLVGMMGVGKTTIGVRLAARLGRAFVDTDQEVERVTGRTIAEIFDTEGEACFRALEAEAVRTATTDGAVVALGGGAVATLGAMERLLERGEVVFLMADPETLIERIEDPASRPLLAGLDRQDQIDKLRMLLAEREHFYRQARIQIDARGTADETVDRIVSRLTEKERK